jgi:endonuclease YncB( thermonuclease family)
MLFANKAVFAPGYTRRALGAAYLATAIGLIAACGIGAARADVIGEALVIDGDTLQVATERIRLHGIDAPETNQVCGAGPAAWPCGRMAADGLVAAIKSRPVRCTGNKRDRYGRLLAVCHAGSVDLNAAMVRDGWALAYRRYAKDYVPQEIEARAESRGLWRGSFEAPWSWRKGDRTAAVRD